MGGAGRIPWSKAMMFADVHGMDSEERSRLWFLMGALDSVYLEWLAEKQKVDTKKTK